MLKSVKSIMRWTVVCLVLQTSWTTAYHVWCEKRTTACSVTASVVKCKLFEIQVFQIRIWNTYRVFCIFWVKPKVFDRSISNIIFKSIFYFLFNALPKSDGDRHVGIYASPDGVGLLVILYSECRLSLPPHVKHCIDRDWTDSLAAPVSCVGV